MNQETLVSIIVPAYNAQNFIEETIRSVLMQTYHNWEMIIVDDGSTDNTAKVIAPFLSDSRIKYVFQQNGKQGKARNLAISFAKGYYLAFLDADDLWTADKLEKQIGLMQSQNVDIVFTQGWHFTDSTMGNLIDFNSPIGFQNPNLFFKTLMSNNPIKMLSVIIKKDAVLNVGGFNEDLKIQNTEDYQLWIRLADLHYQFYGMEERLFYYRVHANQSTTNFSESIVPKIWTLNSVAYNSISKSEVVKIMESKLDRFLLIYADRWTKKKLNEVIELYKKPIGNYKKYVFCKLLEVFSVTLLKKLGYSLFNPEKVNETSHNK
jgi:glycosyltransferase involved in cell wall biosynthesis